MTGEPEGEPLDLEQLLHAVAAYANHPRKDELVAVREMATRYNPDCVEIVESLAGMLADASDKIKVQEALLQFQSSCPHQQGSTSVVNINNSIVMGDGSHVTSRSPNSQVRHDPCVSPTNRVVGAPLPVWVQVVGAGLLIAIAAALWLYIPSGRGRLIVTLGALGTLGVVAFKVLRWHRLAASALFGSVGLVQFAFAGSVESETELGIARAIWEITTPSDVISLALLATGVLVLAIGEASRLLTARTVPAQKPDLSDNSAN